MTQTQVTDEELHKFTDHADSWWDEGGAFAPLHRMTPTRMHYIKQQICAHYKHDALSLKPFEGLNVLDIGCGGGLTSEPLTRLGASCTGVDAGAENIEAAKEHAKRVKLDIDYRHGLSYDVIQESELFDVVVALEVIEHVEDPAAFVKSCAAHVKPGGLIIFSTLNRTPKSFALGIVAAEYILRWVPRGTHEWKKFLKPSELARFARAADLDVRDVHGLMFNPLKNEFALSPSDTDVNYFLSAEKALS